MSEEEAASYVAEMTASVRLAGGALLACVMLVVAMTWPVLALCLVAGTLLLAACSAWYFMFRAAFAQVGRGYAVRHLILAIVLTPLLLAGVFAIPLLVRSDLAKRTEAGSVPQG
jgi:hypothetical protein